MSLRQRLSDHFLIAAIAGQPAQLAQGLLVLVQQAADGELDEVGILAGALVPGRQLGAAVAAELAARVRREGRHEGALDAAVRLVGELAEGRRVEPGEGDAEPERQRRGLVVA